MENINSPEALKGLKELLIENDNQINVNFLNSINNVKSCLKDNLKTNFLIKHDVEGVKIVYSDSFLDYIIETGFREAQNYKELIYSIKQVYTPQFMELLKDYNVSQTIEYNVNSLHPLEIDFNFNNGIVIKHNNEIIKQEFSDIQKRIKAIKDTQKSIEQEKGSNLHL